MSKTMERMLGSSRMLALTKTRAGPGIVKHARRGGVGLVDHAVDPEPTGAQGDAIFAGETRIAGRLGVGVAVGDQVDAEATKPGGATRWGYPVSRTAEAS